MSKDAEMIPGDSNTPHTPEMNVRRKKQAEPFFKAVEEEGSSLLKLNSDSTDIFSEKIQKATGTDNDIIARVGLSSAVAAAPPFGQKSSQNVADFTNTVGLTMEALAPQDEIEGHLVSQLAVLQQHAMHWLAKAVNTERVDFANVYMNGASKMLARHHETIETLMRYRRNGEQRVHVEHVHVHEGGQAIVGNVITRGGANQKVEEGPHAKV